MGRKWWWAESDKELKGKLFNWLNMISFHFSAFSANDRSSVEILKAEKRRAPDLCKAKDNTDKTPTAGPDCVRKYWRMATAQVGPSGLSTSWK